MAGRIPQSFINELVARLDIVDIIERRIDLKKKGRNYSACCPFHNEKTPSFSVSPDKQFYHCFGCGASGNAVTFLMEYEGQDFVSAIEDLAQSVGMEIPREEYSNPSQDFTNHLYPLMEQVSNFYQSQLKNNPKAKKAIDYLKNRGLSGEIAKKYAIGYAPEEWQNLSSLDIKAKNIQQDLIDTGMMIKNDKGHTYDRFRDRIMFPIRNRRGQTIGFGGRIIDQGEPKYLNSPETKLFHKGKELYGLYEMRKKLRNYKHILVVEGYMDVVALAQFGIFNAAATLGTATSSEHLQTLFRLCPKIVLCFDGDKAGKAAALRALQNALPLLKDAREVRIMFLPDGEDPDTMIRKIGASAFNQQIEEANTLFDFLFNYLTAQVDMNTFEGPARLVHLAKPFSQSINDSILKARFEQRIASLAGLTEKQFNDATQANQSSSSSSKPKTAPPQKQNTINKPKPIKIQGKAPFRRAIAMVLQNPDALPAANLDWIGKLDEAGATIFAEIVQLIENNETITTGMIIENWRDKPEEIHLKKLASLELLLATEQIPAELADTLVRLEKEIIVDQWDSLIAKSRHQPLDQEEKSRLKLLQKEINRKR